MRLTPSLPALGLMLLFAAGSLHAQATAERRVDLEIDQAAGELRVSVAGRPAFVHRWGPGLELPYIHPLLSPSGRSMTIEHPQKFPHHRSLWFADKVQLAGHRVTDFYNAFNQRKADAPPGENPFPHRIRQLSIDITDRKPDRATIQMILQWELDADIPVLREQRTMTVIALGDGEYLLDLRFQLTAAHGEVKFVSDAVHYAWPYVRMDEAYSVPEGAQLRNARGGTGQAETHGQIAEWVDYSRAFAPDEVDGLTMFTHPETGDAPRWLTRDYGTFGPRRPDHLSGQPFTLTADQSLTQRVALLIHRGDATTAKLAQRYRLYVEGRL